MGVSTELIIIRHGETDANVKGALSGWTDISLNERGIEQVKTTAKKLKELKITDVDTVFSSPLKRAAQTAELIRTELRCQNVVYSNDLKERNFGDWEGLTMNEIKKMYENEYGLWMNDINYCMNNAEEICNVKERVRGFLGDIIHITNESTEAIKDTKITYIVVTHLGCIRYMIPILLDMPDEYSWRFRVDNGSFIRICINEEGYAYFVL